MKQALVQTLDQSGHTFGQVNNPNDLMKAQGFVHERISGVVNDFINRSSRPEVVGFDQTLGAGTAFNMTVAKGRVYTQNGISYDRNTSTTVTFDAAHASLPRIDIVVAKIEDDVDAELDLIPFVRLRTPEEFTAEVPAYAPSNISAPTEKHWRSTIQIIKGTPAEVPAKPTLATNEIALYEVVIPAASVSLQSANVIDRRQTADTVRMLTDRDVQHGLLLAELQRRLAIVEDLGGQPIDLSQIFGEVRSLEEILADLLNRATSSADYPEIRYNPAGGALQYNAWDIQNWKTRAAGAFGSGVAHIDFDLGLTVNFGDAEVVLTPDSFVDPALNARYYTPTGNEASHLTRNESLTINDVTQGANDGSVAFNDTGLNLTPLRSRPAAAARSARYVEIFGGQSLDGLSGLSDWHTYDRENNTLTARTITGDALPASDRPAMFTCGDGTHVLVLAGVGSDYNATVRCFVVNAVTGVSVEIATTKPIGNEFCGDLIADDKIFIMANRYVTGVTTFWEYTISTNTFVSVNTTGNVPTDSFRDNALGCYYAENQFIHITAYDSKTLIYDRTTLQWTEVTVNKPFERQVDQNGDYIGSGHQGARMANINGRPTITGGFVYNSNNLESGGSWSYELGYSVPVPQATGQFGTPRLVWKETLISVPRSAHHTLCSTLGSTGRANGFGFQTGGGNPYQTNEFGKVYASRAGGMIVSSYNGLPGISIAEGSTFAQFEIDPFATALDVTGYFASFAGRYTKQTLKVEISFDNGVTWQEYTPDLAISRTPSAVTRRMRVTLFRAGANPPILTGVTESFDTDSALDLEQRTVIRIDTPQDDEFYALHIDRLGKARFTNTSNPPYLEPSTGGKCLLLLMIATSGAAPTLTPLINRRRPIERITAVKNASATETVYTFLAVPVRYFEVIGIASGTKHVYKPAEHPSASATFRMFVTINKTEIPEGDTYEVTFYG